MVDIYLCDGVGCLINAVNSIYLCDEIQAAMILRRDSAVTACVLKHLHGKRKEGVRLLGYWATKPINCVSVCFVAWAT